MIHLHYCMVYLAICWIKCEIVESLVTRKRVPPDEHGLSDPKTIFSSKFKNWNASLTEANVIPDVIQTEVPQPLTVVYFEDNVEFGNLLEYDRVDISPIDLDWLSHENEYYTALMTDPDYPDPKNPSRKEYLHWMKTNIKHAFIKNGKTLARYLPPSNKLTAKFSNVTYRGIHRIVFVVYKQLKGSISVQPDLYTPPEQLDEIKVIPHNREHFSSIDFAKQHNLTPYAANFFTINLDIVEEE